MLDDKVPVEGIFDGARVTARTNEISATITIEGRRVSDADIGRFLVIRGGENFIIGPYLIMATDSAPNTWTLDRPCTTGAGAGMTGKFVNPKGRWHKPVPEYYDENSPSNPAKGQARQAVLKALNLIEPGVLKSLVETCLKRELLEPEATDVHDWCCSVEDLQWGHLPSPVEEDAPDKTVYLRNLKPLRDAIVGWTKDEPRKRWNLCDDDGEPIDWIAEAAVQTLVWWHWHRKGRLPKTLRWESLDLDHYRALDSDEAWDMFDLERKFDASSGLVRVVPEDGEEASRLSDRAQRVAKQEYKELGAGLGLTRMPQVSARYFEWYALQTFLGLTLREIRNREMVTTRSGSTGLGIGDLSDPNDLSSISHGIEKVADLVDFRRAL